MQRFYGEVTIMVVCYVKTGQELLNHLYSGKLRHETKTLYHLGKF